MDFAEQVEAFVKVFTDGQILDERAKQIYSPGPTDERLDRIEEVGRQIWKTAVTLTRMNIGVDKDIERLRKRIVVLERQITELRAAQRKGGYRIDIPPETEI